MKSIKAFPTLIYSGRLSKEEREVKALNKQLLEEAADIASLDVVGVEWSQKNYRNGFTSYASANELHKFSSTFQRLEAQIDRHVKRFAKELDFDLGGTPLKMATCWLNIMNENTHHGMHLHPLSVVSGTYYLQMPKGASAIKFEDPRLSKFMGAPPRKVPCRPGNKPFLEIPAEAGTVVLFDSWLRHEVPLHTGKQQRISISFNYGWGD